MFCFLTRWSVAKACAPHLSKLRVLVHIQLVECIECNETWQGSRLINYLFIGVYFIQRAFHCDVIIDVQIWHQKENSGKKWLKFDISFLYRIMISGENPISMG